MAQICSCQDSKRMAWFQRTRALSCQTRSISDQTERGRVLNRVCEIECDLLQVYFAQMATRIQAHWRGYASRKYIHDFYQRKRYIQSVLEANSAVRVLLEEAERDTYVELERLAVDRNKTEIASRLDRMHHLLSTASVQGTLHAKSCQLLDAKMGAELLEDAVRRHRRLSRTETQTGDRQSPLETSNASTIRVDGPYDHVREERSLQRRVEKAYAAAYCVQPFTSSIRNIKAWRPLTTLGTSDHPMLETTSISQ